MITLILLLITILIFKILFSNFGFLPDTDEQRKNEAINNFTGNMSRNNNDDKSQKNIKNINSTVDTDNNTVKNNKSNLTKQLTSFFQNICNIYRKKNIKKSEKTEEEIIKEEKAIEEIFKKTAERASMIILDSFNNKNYKALKDMLTPEMFTIFEKNMKEAEEKKYSYKTVVISFDEVNIIEKDLKDSNKFVKLSFKMKQINYAEDEEGNVVAGSKSKVVDVVEKWVFVNNSESNMWFLKSIE